MDQPIIVGVSGGSGSGKTTAAKLLQQGLGPCATVIVQQDRYYFDQGHKFDCDGGAVNYDHPSAIDFALMAQQLTQLKQGARVMAPRYDFTTHTRKEGCDLVEPKPFIIVDGTLILTQSQVRACLDYSIYVDASENFRFDRRISRDVAERGRSVYGIKNQLYQQVRPMHDHFVNPSKDFADAVVNNNKSLEELSQQIAQIIAQRHWQKVSL